MYKKISTINGHDFTTEYTLTPGGRVSTITYPGGRTVTYDRNEECACEVEGVSTTFNGNSKTLLSSISYRPFGGASALTVGSGQGSDQVANQFDLAGRIVHANYGQPKGQTYTYDNNGNLTSMTTPSEASIYSRAFDYDNLNRLTGATGPYGTISYQYDDVGNRTQRIMNSLTEAYSYDQGTNLLDQITSDAGTITYTYDSNGNTIGISDTAKSESWVLTWTYDDRLMAVAKNGDVVAQYVYNGFGQRVKKIIDGETTLYHYDFDGKLIAESDDDGYTHTKAEYLYRGQSLLAKVDYEDYSPTTISRYLNDQLGTPQIMTNDSNQVIWEALYEPFGDAAVNYQSTVENNIRFPGQYLDAETGFHYNYHRYYDPRTGRYLSADPIGQVGGINLYTYVGNNPVNGSDVLGLWPSSTHDEMIGRTFAKLPPEFLEAIMKGSQYADTFQNQRFSYMHAMRSTGQSVELAEKLMIAYMRDRLIAYQCESQRGNWYEAYFALGMALHPVMDSTSPTHDGFQWWGTIRSMPVSYSFFYHYLTERWRLDLEIANTAERMKGTLRQFGINFIDVK